MGAVKCNFQATRNFPGAKGGGSLVKSHTLTWDMTGNKYTEVWLD